MKNFDKGLSELVQTWRESLDRKRERHGAAFDEDKAIQDLYARLAGLPAIPMVAVLAGAIDRLAKMPDYQPVAANSVNSNPVPAEIADLDFDFDFEADSEDEGEES